MLTLAIAAVATLASVMGGAAAIVGGAKLPGYLRQRRARLEAARSDLAAAETERRQLELAADEQRRSAEADAAARAADQEHSTVRGDPVTAVAPAAIEGAGSLLPAWAEVQAAERALVRADLEVSRTRQATADVEVPAGLDTPGWRSVLGIAPWGVAVVVVIETVLNYSVFEPLVGATLAPLVAPLAAGVLGAAALWAGMAIRACAAGWAAGRTGSYGAWVLLLGGVVASVAAVVGMMWLAPARSAGRHDATVATEQGNVAAASLRFNEDPTAKRSLEEAEARLRDAERDRAKAATTDRVVVLGSSVLEMGLVELLLLGAPMRERRRAQVAEAVAENARVEAVERRAEAKVAHTQQLNPIVTQMIDYLVGHGLGIEVARAAVEKAFVHAGVVDGVAQIVRLTREQYGEPALDHHDHTVVTGEVAVGAGAPVAAPTSTSGEVEPVDPEPAPNQAPDEHVARDEPPEQGGPLVDDEYVDLDAPPPDAPDEDAGAALPARPSLDDYDMFAWTSPGPSARNFRSERETGTP